jgi:hypothetical protein
MYRIIVPALSVFVLLAMQPGVRAQPAPAPSQIEMPAPNDEEGWTALCEGFYVELVRQANGDGDQNQFADATRRIGNLTTELLYQTTAGTWRFSPERDLTWAQNGRRMAGAELWDLPLAPGDTPTWRDMARRARQAPERMCTDRSDQAAMYPARVRGLLLPK